MIKLVENNKEAALVLDHLSVDFAPLLATKMFTEGFGVQQEFLQFYAAFNDNGKLCAAFVKCNDRVFCLIEILYDIDEILWFLEGFKDFKLFISSEYSYIINRDDHYICNLMMKPRTKNDSGICIEVPEISCKDFTSIIMQGKDKDAYIRFLLNNSHLHRHGYLRNHAEYKDNSAVSIASVFITNGYCYLCNVFTPELSRGNGYAASLINKITQNDKEYHLICNEEVSRLYEKSYTSTL